MFLGMSYAGMTAAENAIGSDAISTITLKNALVDEMYATEEVLLEFDWNIPSAWDANTQLHAEFEETLHAGNLEYNTNIVTYVKIKKRFVGDFEWKTVYEQEVNVNDDFEVKYYDYYNPADRDVEYAYVVVKEGEDVESATSQVKSEFYSYFICGNNGESYPMIVNAKNDYDYERESTIIKTFGSKYPFINHNGSTQYYGGNMTVSFFQFDDNCQLDAKNAWKYRKELDQFLADGQPKIIKSFEGDMWMVDVHGTISHSENGHYQLIDQSFEWAEIGDPYSIKDLYWNGFINTDVDVK